MTSGRPQPGEYAPYAEADIARVEGDDVVCALQRQELDFMSRLRGLGEARVAGLRYAPGKWTVKEVIGHIIDDERIFAYRILCVARGDTRPLESFDEKAYVRGANFEDRTLASFIDEYACVRASTVALLRSLSGEAWSRRGTVAGYEATVRGLAWHIAGHELHHVTLLEECYFER